MLVVIIINIIIIIIIKTSITGPSEKNKIVDKSLSQPHKHQRHGKLEKQNSGKQPTVGCTLTLIQGSGVLTPCEFSSVLTLGKLSGVRTLGEFSGVLTLRKFNGVLTLRK